MGSATLDLTSLDLGRPTDVTLALQDPDRPEAPLGEVVMTVTLYPKSQEDKEQVITISLDVDPSPRFDEQKETRAPSEYYGG
jgi:hypothetical protein